MRSLFWYNQGVPKEHEKKTVQIGVKLPESLYIEIERICKAEDRPVGYVARELMVRGLNLYSVDGYLRDNLQDLRKEVDAERAKGKVVGTITPGKKKDPSKEDVRIMYQNEAEIIHLGEAEKPQRKKKAS